MVYVIQIYCTTFYICIVFTEVTSTSVLIKVLKILFNVVGARGSNHCQLCFHSPISPGDVDKGLLLFIQITEIDAQHQVLAGLG